MRVRIYAYVCVRARYLIEEQRQKVVEKEAETKRKQAIIEAQKSEITPAAWARRDSAAVVTPPQDPSCHPRVGRTRRQGKAVRAS